MGPEPFRYSCTCNLNSSRATCGGECSTVATELVLLSKLTLAIVSDSKMASSRLNRPKPRRALKPLPPPSWSRASWASGDRPSSVESLAL